MQMKTETRQRAVPPHVKRRLTEAVKRARKRLDELESTVQLEKDANDAIKRVRDIVGTEAYKEGQLTPFGHRVNALNGKLEMAIVNSEKVDVADWLRNMISGPTPKTRKSGVKDNRAVVVRAQDHIRYLAGNTERNKETVRKRLKLIGLEEKVDEITDAMKPIARLFDQYVKAGNF